MDGVSGATDISKAVVSITATLTSMNKSFTTMVNSLRKAGKELQTALENAESCDDLNAAGGPPRRGVPRSSRQGRSDLRV